MNKRSIRDQIYGGNADSSFGEFASTPKALRDHVEKRLARWCDARFVFERNVWVDPDEDTTLAKIAKSETLGLGISIVTPSTVATDFKSFETEKKRKRKDKRSRDTDSSGERMQEIGKKRKIKGSQDDKNCSSVAETT